MSSSSQDSPDVVGAANATGQADRATTRDVNYANNPDQYGSFGSRTSGQEMVIDPATGEEVAKWTVREQLSPEMQEAFNQDMNMNLGLGATAGSMNQRINDSYATPMDWASYGDPITGPQASGPIGGNVDPTTAANRQFGGATDQLIGGGLQATSSGGGYSGASSELTGGDLQGTTGSGEFAWDSANRGRAEDASYGRSTSRLDPQWQQKRAEFERTMVGRGLRAGDSAFDSGMQNFDRSSNDAYEQARLGSVSEGRMEDQQSYGQAKGSWDSNRAAEQQRFDQSARAAENARAARSQRYGEGYNDWQSGQTAEQQAFSQNQQVGENERSADTHRYDQQLGQFGTNRGVEQQAFGQQIDSGTNNRQADQQSFDQGVTATAAGNALRTQNISEDLAIRNMPLEERNRLMASRNIGQMGQDYSSGG